MRRIAIIGGGIAGLSAAFHLEKAKQSGVPVAYELFEQGARLGGILHTERAGDFVVEAGADSFLTEKPWASELCRELGLEGKLIGSNDERRKTYVLINGELRPLPEGLQFIVPTGEATQSDFFSVEARKQFARETELKPRANEDDESVAEFVERHFGRELLEHVADPMLAGIYGGEAERLSARAALPRFVELERKHGSLIKAMQGARRTPQGSSAAIFTSLKSGMGELIEALVKKLDAKNLHLNQNIERLSRRGKKWICTRNGSQEFEAVIVALPAWVAAKLLASESPELAQTLARIRYTSSMTVALGFDAKAIERAKPLPPGFGFLVPRNEGRRLLACTLVHNKFPHRAPGGSHLVRLFFGGARDESALSLSDVEAISLARRELREITGFDATTDLARVWRWPRAMAQYDVGHLELVKEIEQLAQKLPELALAGNAYHGVGIPDCIRGGRDAAQSLL